MTGERVVHVRAIGQRTVELIGSDRGMVRAVALALDDLAVPYMRAPRGHSWLVRQDAADDVMALLESRRYQLEVTL